MKDITGGALQRSFFLWVLTPSPPPTHTHPIVEGRRAQGGGENLATVNGFGTRNSQHLVHNRMCTGPTALPAALGCVASGVVTIAFLLNTYHAPSRLPALPIARRDTSKGQQALPETPWLGSQTTVFC